MTDLPADQGQPAARHAWPALFTPQAGRMAAGLGLLLFLLGLGRSAFFLARMHDGVIGGDSFTYVTSAKRLAQGTLIYMDGPVAEMIRQAARPAGRRYWEPIWNHAARPDGQTICSMAIGYPLLLSVAYRAGGLWLLCHLNLLLTLGFLLMVALVAWEGLGRDRLAGLTGAATALLLPFIVPSAIRQFTFPWREPYFYILLLGAVWALLRFARSGRGVWLCALALLSGIACSVKEVNALYVLWFGVMVLTLPAYRRHPRVIWLTLGCVALFFLGLAPLLVQNAAGTGNPFVSLQMLRETGQYSLNAPGAGLSMGNVDTTLARYIAMYAANPFYAPWALALAGLGVALTARRLLGRTLLGVAVLHFILYTQWGNADLRQSFFFNVPYAFFLVAGPFLLLGRLGRSGPARLAVHALLLAVLAGLALGPSPFFKRGKVPPTPEFRYADGRRLAAEIDAQIPEDGLLLVNRSVRDILGVFSRRPIARLSELYNLHPDRDVHPLIEPLVNSGRLYFLDNVDQDPHYAYRANRTEIDRETLLERYRLVPVAAWDRKQAKLDKLINRAQLMLYRAEPWAAGPGRRELAVPAGGAAFLFVNRRAAGSNLIVTLDGRMVPVPEDGGYYCPVADWPLGTQAVAEWSLPGGGPVPPLDDLALIGWDDVIHVDIALDASPRDGPHVPDGFTLKQRHAPWRVFPAEFRLRLPVSARPDASCVGCLAGVAGLDTDDCLEITTPDGASTTARLKYNKCYFNVPETALNVTTQGAASNAMIGFRLTSNTSIQVSRVDIFPSRRVFTIAPAPDSRGFFWSGRIMPAQTESESAPWSVLREGAVLASGLGNFHPYSESNDVYHIEEFAAGAGPVRFEIQGGGLIDYSEVQVGAELAIRLDCPARCFVAYELYPVERNEKGETFCWTKASLPVPVPLTPGATAYRLRLDARDGKPGKEPRELEVQFGAATERVRLDPGRREYEWILPAPSDKDWGLATVEFRIPTWSPARELGVGDRRELGFQFHGLDWQPVLPAGAGAP